MLTFNGLFGQVRVDFESAVRVGQKVKQDHHTWYAGTWDASLRSWGEHRRILAIRLEIVDSRTLIGIQDVRVILRGE